MSDPQNFDGANAHYHAPRGFEEMIGSLHVFKNGRSVVSAWKPSAALLESLNNGGLIFVNVLSGDVVLPIYVGSEEECKAVTSDTGRVW